MVARWVKGVVVLFERGDLAERFLTLGAVLGDHEFIAVDGGPLFHETARPWGKTALHD